MGGCVWVCVVVGGGALLVEGAGELLDGVAELLLLVGELEEGVAVVVTGAAWVVTWVVAWVVAALWWAFFLWCTFFLWCCLALWCVVVVLVVSAARCCLDLCVVVEPEPPQPAMATAATTVATSARFIAPLRSLEDVDSGAGMLAQMLGRSHGSGGRRLAAITLTTTARRLADKTGNMTTIWPGLLEGAFAPLWKLLTCTCTS